MKRILYGRKLLLLIAPILLVQMAYGSQGGEVNVGWLAKTLTDIGDVANAVANNQTLKDMANAAGDGMRAVGNAIGDSVRAVDKHVQKKMEENQRLYREKQEAMLAEERKLQQRIDDPSTPESVKQQLVKILEKKQDERAKESEAQRKKEAGWDENLRNMANLVPEGMKMVMKMAADRAELDGKKQIENIKGHHAAKGVAEAAKETTKQWVAFASQPTTALKIVAVAGGIFACYHGAKFAAKVIQDKYELPQLADKENTSLIPMSQKMYNWVFGVKPPEAKLTSAIFEPKLAAQIASINESLKNIVANGGILPNMLLWGPPGTGKTLVAKLLARSCGMEYIYFAADALESCSEEVALSLLLQLFRFAGDYPKKLMIIIDEAETVLGDRGNPKISEKTKKLVKLILTYTGSECRNYSVIALTNRPQDLDEAYRSRCDYQIQIDVPGYDQVLAMLKMYINNYLVEASDLQPPQHSLVSYDRWFGKPVERKIAKIEQGALSEEVVEQLAQTLVDNRFVGRDISKLILKIRSSAYASQDYTITPDMVQQVVEMTIAAKKAEREGYKRKHDIAAAAA